MGAQGALGRDAHKAGEALGWEGRRASHTERGPGGSWPGGWKVMVGRGRAHVGMVLGLGEASEKQEERCGKMGARGSRAGAGSWPEPEGGAVTNLRSPAPAPSCALG